MAIHSDANLKKDRAPHLFVQNAKMASFDFSRVREAEEQTIWVRNMEDEEFLGCISCMSTTDLYDLFAVYEENGEAYASMFESCFDIKIPPHVRYVCSDCADVLERAAAFKELTCKSVAKLKEAFSQDEEYLDEKILEEEEDITNIVNEEKHEVKTDEEEAGEACKPEMEECHICGLSVDQLDMHLQRCHTSKMETDSRKYPCHFCENVYISKKACFTHLRMKHGLKLCPEQGARVTARERKKCHLCSRDFSQKQILNKHLWKAHGIEVEKRKAFVCPLCSERVSYGAHFSAHLLRAHRLQETVEKLHFQNMDDFLLFKSAVQEETKYRFRKTTASKQTIEGVRSHYMCSQSGVYVYQGKGKRVAPERQIYKTGKACPAHMIVTETLDNVHVVFYKTHVGHGPCPYFEPREAKKPRAEPSASYILPDDMDDSPDDIAVEEAAVCDLCGLVCADAERCRLHRASHAADTLPCYYCRRDFPDTESWARHIKMDHKMNLF